MVEKLHREAVEQYRQEKKKEEAVVEAVHRQAIEYYRRNPPPPREPPKGVHYTELPAANEGQTLATEWNTYRKEAGRLLAEGHEGRYVLIKNQLLVGIFDSLDAAYEEGLKRYLLEPMLVKEICTYEPILRARGYNLPCLRLD